MEWARCHKNASLATKKWMACKRFCRLVYARYPETNESSVLTFELFLISQFDWVNDDDIESLDWLYERILEPNFQRQDRDNLTGWLKVMHEDTKNRQL